MLTASEIRRKFIEYFSQNGHTPVESSSLVPKDDPSLLFTNAGMVQFKKVFLGQEKRPYSRAVTAQKCLRVGGKHNDLENVGRTARHHTFFEMLGNFSFGDYFKADAIRLAWNFLTKELGLPPKRLYVTVYNDDDEASDLWQKITGIPEGRIYRLGEKDNFWSMGDTGPCGPCSEIMVDQGEHMSCGPSCGIGTCDCDRFLEVWNLVFMQYDRDESGRLIPLPRPSIDTGMGLERITAVCQGVFSNFDSDIFREIIDYTASLAKVTYRKDDETDTALRVIADHSRSVTFLIADNILPSNEGRGYVLRRLIRRAYRFGKLIGLTEPFLFEVCRKVTALMGAAYPEALANVDFMTRVVREEEERFGQTLDKGLKLLSEELEILRGAGKTVIPGETAFKLYDTYGFPLDIINDVAEKQGLTVDEPGFQACMKEQKTRAKQAWKGSGENDPAQLFATLLETGMQNQFVGYDDLTVQSRIVALLEENGQTRKRLIQGEGGYVVTAKTPFYGASGGQLGDVGRVETMTGVADVLDAIKPSQSLTVQKVFIHEGELLLEQEATLTVSEDVRLASARNHTCTHLLQAALRKVLGKHVNQAGSLVTPERLRFDFTHTMPMTAEEISEVEDEVNRAILADSQVKTAVIPHEKAVKIGATALFGEKYGDMVRVVEVPGVSLELCGGTHLRATGQAGTFVVLQESGVASGVRRIEALTGFNALNHINGLRYAVTQLQTQFKVPATELPAKIKALHEQLKNLTREKESLQTKLLSGQGRDLMSGVEKLNGVNLLVLKIDAPDPKAMRELMDDIRSKMPSGVVLLAAAADGKVMLTLSVTKDLHPRFTAPALIKELAPLVGGSGGGRPDMAQAGGTKAEGLDEALVKIRELLSK